jgi:hypothetical protein
LKNLAILVDKLGCSQKFISLSQQLNKLSSDINVTVFYCESGPLHEKINLPALEIVNGYIYEGIVIATDIYTAQIMNNMMATKDKYYYPWDLEYIYRPYSIDTLKSVFNNKLIARNQTRFDILASTWHKPEVIIEDFNYEELGKLFSV